MHDQSRLHGPFLAALLVLLLAYPLVLKAGYLGAFRAVFAGTLIMAVVAVGGRRKLLLLAVALAAPALLGQLLMHVRGGGLVDETTARFSGLVAGAAFLAFVTVVILRSVLAAGRVTADKIAGAISVYLLLGLVWSLLFGVVHSLDPSAFSPANADAHTHTPADEYRLVFFSFVTLTTLGYGDITPLTPIAQTLSWMEAVVGQLYLAVLVARLVGLHIAARE